MTSSVSGEGVVLSASLSRTAKVGVHLLPDQTLEYQRGTRVWVDPNSDLVPTGISNDFLAGIVRLVYPKTGQVVVYLPRIGSRIVVWADSRYLTPMKGAAA